VSDAANGSHHSQYTNATVIVPLAEVPYVDRPSIQVSAAESVEMPFKYVKGKDGKAIMPEVSQINLERLLSQKLMYRRA
jgi:ribosome biogenesis SPOUT family RNA methylase Rps3